MSKSKSALELYIEKYRAKAQKMAEGGRVRVVGQGESLKPGAFGNEDGRYVVPSMYFDKDYVDRNGTTESGLPMDLLYKFDERLGTAEARPEMQGINTLLGKSDAIGGATRRAANNFTITNGYQAQLAPTTQSNYADAITAAQTAALGGTNAVGQAQTALTGVAGQQQNLADMLAAQARGEGPNPVQEQFKQNLDMAAKQAAGAVSSQKGINPALAARIVSQNLSGVQQGAASNAAQLQAQQQLAAQSALGSTLTNLGNTNQAIGGLGLQQQANNTNLYGVSGQLQNNQNTGQVNNYAMQQGINAQIAQNNTNALQKTNAGLQSGMATAMGIGTQQGSPFSFADALEGGAALATATKDVIDTVKGKWEGGVIRKMNAGGSIPMDPSTVQVPSLIAKETEGGAIDLEPEEQERKKENPVVGAAKGAASGASIGAAIGSIIPGLGTLIGGLIGGGAGAIAGGVGSQMSEGGKVSFSDALATHGGRVPGRAQVKGDSPKNDTVPTMLSPGEIVIPRTKATPDKAKEFVAALQRKSRKKAK